jgi:hypothetical protein
MHELVDLGHSMTHAVVGLCRDETRTSEHIGISLAEEDWTVANDNEMYLVAALTRNVLQYCGLNYFHGQSGLLTCLCLPCCHGFSLGPLRPPGCFLTPFPGAVPTCLACLILWTASVMTMSPILVCVALRHCPGTQN